MGSIFLIYIPYRILISFLTNSPKIVSLPHTKFAEIETKSAIEIANLRYHCKVLVLQPKRTNNKYSKVLPKLKDLEQERSKDKTLNVNLTNLIKTPPCCSTFFWKLRQKTLDSPKKRCQFVEFGGSAQQKVTNTTDLIYWTIKNNNIVLSGWSQWLRS